MAMIDYGAMLRVDGKFINMNKGLFMETSDTGYMVDDVLDTVGMWNKPNLDTINIKGNHYVYAGDQDLMLCFYKGSVLVTQYEKLIGYFSWSPFISESRKIANTEIIVKHLDPVIYENHGLFDFEFNSWTEYVKSAWFESTGNERDYELENGTNQHKIFRKLMKNKKRYTPCKERTNRWIASWQHDGKYYEVIFGWGIDPNEDVWNEVKYKYGFTDRERRIIDEWFRKENQTVS